VSRLLFIQAKHRGFFRLTLWTTFMAFLWIILGVYIQKTGSALACPDWPQCFGLFTAPHTTLQLQLAAERFPHTAITLHNIELQVAYRYLSVAVLACIVLLTLNAARLWNELPANSFLICCGLIGLSSTEITLRMHTVIQNQQPLFLLSHALIAFGIVSLLWWLNRITHPDAQPTSNQSYQNIRPWAWLSLLLVFQVILSIAINISYVNSLCQHFAFCSDALTTLLHVNTLNLDNHTLLQTLISQKMLNIIAFLSLGYLCLFSALLMMDRQINHLAFFILTLVITEIILVSPKFAGINLTLFTLCQTGIAACLLMAIISLLIHIHRTPHHYWSR
jgi:heme A synthase